MPPPRLPDFVYNTYRQYKHNCNLINEWVHSTVARLRADTTATRTNPKRGKTRNQGSDELSSPRMTFHTFLKLVREIAFSDVNIPTSLIALISVTVKQRKATAAFYSTDADAWRQNLSHVKAIEVYETALRILEDAHQSRSASSTERDKSTLTLTVGDQDVFGLTVTMHQLSIIAEEDLQTQSSATVDLAENEWIRDNPMIHRPSAKGQKPKIKKFPLEDYELVLDDRLSRSAGPKQDEAQLALTCFVLDINRIRKYCHDMWKSMAPVGDVPRATTAFVTNHAVNMVKRLEYDLVADFPEFKNVLSTQEMLIERTLPLLRVITSQSIYNLQEQLMMNTASAFDAFIDVLRATEFPVMKDGHFGFFDPSADRDLMSVDQKIREDKCIMCNYWPDLYVLYKRLKKRGTFPGSHGLPDEFQAFLKDGSRTITWTFVFCCQMYLDIVHIRRRFLQHDLETMRSFREKILRELDDFTNDGVKYDTNMDLIKEHLDRVAQNVDFWLGEDPLTELKIKSGWDKLSRQACQKDSLWYMNPWLMANAIADSLVEFFEAGVSISSTAGFVQSAMHLWNMLRQTGHLRIPEDSRAVVSIRDAKPRRKDQTLLMDHLVEMFGEKVFSGAPPKEKFCARFELMLGVKAEAYARGKRAVRKTATDDQYHPLRDIPHQEAGRGVLPTISGAWCMYQDRFVPKRSSYNRSGSDSSANRDAHPLALTRALIDSELGEPSSAYDGVYGFQEREPFGPLLNLNLFKIHRLCVRLFTELGDALRLDLERVCRTRYDRLVERQSQLPMITGWIMRGTGDVGFSENLMKSVLLEKAASVVERILGDKTVEFYLFKEEAS